MSALERRIARLEAEAAPAQAIRIAFKETGETAEQAIARLGDLSPNTRVMVISWISPDDTRPDGATLQ